MTREELSELLRLSRKTVGRRQRALARRLPVALDAEGLPTSPGLAQVASR